MRFAITRGVTAVIVAVILRPVFTDNTNYMIAAFLSGIVLAFVFERIERKP